MMQENTWLGLEFFVKRRSTRNYEV
jgi:hypothetical protein